MKKADWASNHNVLRNVKKEIGEQKPSTVQWELHVKQQQNSYNKLGKHAGSFLAFFLTISSEKLLKLIDKFNQKTKISTLQLQYVTN